ncbi:MAG TPA: hypothetical protein VD970_03480 [Acetobacteraceae bacterium]|nr:hypothetical protein [Acetobacteraceae bacterium]
MNRTSRPILACAALAVGLVGLPGCAGTGAAPAGGFADIGDGCRQQVNSFQSAGDPLLRETAAAVRAITGWRPGDPPPWARWAPGARPPTAAAPAPAPAGSVTAELARENAEIDSLQIAFDALLYCRWIEGRQIRADFAAGRLTRPAAEARMAAVRARLRRDLDRARSVVAQLEARDAARADRLEAAAPGARAVAQRANAERGQGTRAIAAASVPLRLRPEAGAPEVGRLAQGASVTVRPASAGFSYVDAGPSQRGYAPTGAFQVASRTVAAPGPAPAVAEGGDVRQLVASNIFRRESFRESVVLAEGAAEGGFELGG